MTDNLFGMLPLVRARVRSGGRQYSAQLGVTGSWDALPSDYRRWVNIRLRTMLHDAGALCAKCGGSTRATTERCAVCAPVEMTLLSGGVEYPLIAADALPYGARNLLLIALCSSAASTVASRLEVEADWWARSGPEKWNEVMGRVVGRLAEDHPGAEIRTFIWDGVRGIPFPRLSPRNGD